MIWLYLAIPCCQRCYTILMIKSKIGRMAQGRLLRHRARVMVCDDQGYYYNDPYANYDTGYNAIDNTTVDITKIYRKAHPDKTK